MSVPLLEYGQTPLLIERPQTDGRRAVDEMGFLGFEVLQSVVMGLLYILIHYSDHNIFFMIPANDNNIICIAV